MIINSHRKTEHNILVLAAVIDREGKEEILEKEEEGRKEAWERA